MSSQQLPEKECTKNCRSKHHADLLLSSVTKGSTAEILSYCNWLCHNFAIVRDELGRNLLHLAASCGKSEVVEWLIDCCHCDIDVHDVESGWTALHRSLFYGQISVARILLNRNANIRAVDKDGLTPLDLVVMNRPPYIEYNLTYPQDVYVWGLNINFNLGLGNQQSREFPEILESFRKENVNIKQVIMRKFHAVFLSNKGQLYTCGHGYGGRLGQGSEVTELTPSTVKGLGSSTCIEVAAGQDHLVMLMDDGQIWTCGLNTYHQLGHVPPPERLVTPKQLPLKCLKGEKILGICAARFHSVFYTKDNLYTFGLNAGQLGIAKTNRTQIAPHQVSGIYDNDCDITYVAVSNGATAYATALGSIYVFHEFQHRKVASKLMHIQKLMVVGGHLDAKCDAAGIFEGGGLELRILVLSKEGELFLWRETDSHMRRCVLTPTHQFVISDAYLNNASVAIITRENQAYLGTIYPTKSKKVHIPVSPTSYKHRRDLNIEVKDVNFIRVKRLPYIHRATKITSDSDGKNFAVLQTCPKVGLLDLPSVSQSLMEKDFSKLHSEACLSDTIHDIIIKVGVKEYAAHKYVLASRSPYFKKHISSLEHSCSEVPKLVVDSIPPEAFEQILKYLYSNTCSFLIEGSEINWMKESQAVKELMNDKKGSKIGPRKKAKEFRNNPLKYMKEVSKHFGLNALSKALDIVRLVDGKVHIPYSYHIPKMRFERNKLKDYYDVCLQSKDGEKFFCHKCILVTRSDYFLSMLASCWIEKTQLESLPLPIPSDVLNILLNYLYSDADSVLTIQDSELLCNVLVTADQLLIYRIKEMCEAALVNLLTLKNAPELLQFASVYNAQQLKRSSMEFISINLASILEYDNMDIIDFDVMDELDQIYHTLMPRMKYRIITPSSDPPQKDFLEMIKSTFPVNQHCERAKQIIERSESKSKIKRRTKSQSSESAEANEDKTKKGSAELLGENSKITNGISKQELKNKRTPPEFEDVKERMILVSSPVSSGRPRPRYIPAFIDRDPDKMPSLKKIMEEESRKTARENNKAHESNKAYWMIVHWLFLHSMKYEKKRLPHVSQRQRKMLSFGDKDNICGSPPGSSNIAHSPPSPSAWGICADVQSVPLSFWNSPKVSSPPARKTDSGLDSSFPSLESAKYHGSPADISFKDIQRDEEALNLRTKPKVKSLGLINIEDQAIEELLVLYKAFKNPNETVTVARVSVGNVAAPTWTKQNRSLLL